MRIINMPDNFSPAFGEVIYTVENSGGGVFDVEILDSGSGCMGIKRFAGEGTVDINTAGYVRRGLSPEPLAGGGCGFRMDNGRAVKSSIRIGNLTSDVRIFTAGLRNLPAGRPLTMLPMHRDIARDESDEISFATDGGTYRAEITVKAAADYKFAVGGHTAGAGICTFVTDMEWVMAQVGSAGGDPEACRSVHVAVFSGDAELFRCIYVLRRNPAGAVRLCWLNSLGAVDRFTFPSPVSGGVGAAKERIVSAGGFETVYSGAERFSVLNSGYRPENVLNALAEIISSPRVWIAGNGGFERVDVTSDSAIVRSEELACLKIRVRENRSVNYQNF